jgi:hypothetical protein
VACIVCNIDSDEKKAKKVNKSTPSPEFAIAYLKNAQNSIEIISGVFRESRSNQIDRVMK